MPFNITDRNKLAKLMAKSGQLQTENARRAFCIRIELEQPDYIGESSSVFSTLLVDDLWQRDDYDRLIQICDQIEDVYKGSPNHKVWKDIYNKLIDEKARVEKKTWFNNLMNEVDQGLVGWWTTEKLQETIQKFENTSETQKQVQKFFDGAFPTWIEATSGEVHRRKQVKQIVDAVESATSINPKVILIHGAGGEGKSTILMQATAELAKNPTLDILWRNDISNTASSMQDLIKNPLEPNQKRVIISDEAHILLRDVYDIAYKKNQEGTGNIVFILCLRTTDYSRSNLDSKSQWDARCDFKEILVSASDIDDDEADKLVDKWMQYDHDDVAKETYRNDFLRAIRDKTGISDGSFFGAMLQVRKGDGENFTAYVERIIDNLKELTVTVPSNAEPVSLFKVFKLIIALHAVGLDILTKAILAKALSVSIEDIDVFIRPAMGREASISVNSQYIYGRYPTISQRAKKILETKGYGFADDYIHLSKSANEAFHDKKMRGGVPDITAWNYLCDKFLETDPNLAVRLAESMYEVEPNKQFLVKLATMYRNTNRHNDAVKLFQNAPEAYYHRALYSEWAIVMGHLGHHCINCWLSALSVSDQVSDSKFDEQRVNTSLRSLAVSFYALHQKTPNQEYLNGALASIKLGLQIEFVLDYEAVTELKSLYKKIMNIDEDKMSEDGMTQLKRSVELLDCNNFAQFNVPKNHKITFRKLEKYINDHSKNVKS